jgi:hypothetical protein
MSPETREEHQTCGKGLAANATLPAGIAAALAALADVLEHHMTALSLDDAAARRESDAYASLVVRARTAMSEAKFLGNEMAGYRDLPAAPHDMTVLTEPRARQVFQTLVEREKQLLELLRERQDVHRAMLDERP